MGRLGHYMLHRPRTWNRFALTSTLEVLEMTDRDRSGELGETREECLDRRDG